MDYCTHVNELGLTEKDIIERNLSDFMKCRGIKDSTQAKMEYIFENSKAMKREFCSSLCPDNMNCDVYKNLLPKQKITQAQP